MPFCSNCATEISDQAVLCPKCGHPGPNVGRVPMTTMNVPAGPGGVPLASWGQRVGAAILDGLIVAVPSNILMAIFGFGSFAASGIRVDPETGVLTGSSASFFGGIIISFIVIFALGIAYRVILEGSDRGQTVGKMVLKIQVRDANNGGPIGYGRAGLRWFVALILWIFFYIPGLVDALFPLWDPKRQTIHDKAASSIVVQVA